MRALAEGFFKAAASTALSTQHAKPTVSAPAAQRIGVRPGALAAGAAALGGFGLYQHIKGLRTARKGVQTERRTKASPLVSERTKFLAGIGAMSAGSKLLQSRFPMDHRTRLGDALRHTGSGKAGAQVDREAAGVHHVFNQFSRSKGRHTAKVMGAVTALSLLADHLHKRRLNKQAAVEKKPKKSRFGYATRSLARLGLAGTAVTGAAALGARALANRAGHDVLRGKRNAIDYHQGADFVSDRMRHALPRTALLAAGVTGASALHDLWKNRRKRMKKSAQPNDLRARVRSWDDGGACLDKAAGLSPYFQQMRTERPEMFALVDRMFAISPEREAELAERCRVSREKHGPPKPEGHSLDAFHW